MSTSRAPRSQDLDHLEAVDDAVLVSDRSGRLVFSNQSARRRYGLGEDPASTTVSQLLLDPEDEGALDEILAQVFEGQTWSGSLEVLDESGAVRPRSLSCSPLRRGGSVDGALWVLHDAAADSVQDREVRRLGDRLRRLARVAADLGRAEDVETVTKIVIDHAADAVGATVASLSILVGDDTLALVGLRGGPEGASARWSTYPLDANNPASEVVRTGRLLVLRGRDTIDERYPGLEHPVEGARSLVGLPLTVLGRTIGVVTLSFPGIREIDPAELEFFAILADSCAQGLERIQSQQEAQRQAARVRFLATAATELSRSLDYARTLARVARLSVPDFADWCAIDLVADDHLQRLAVEHVDPAKVALALDLERRYPSERSSPNGPWEVIRTGKRQLIPVITDEMLVAGARDEEHLRIARALDLRSAITVPLVARSRVLGVMTWVSAESGRRYTESDATFAEDLAERCALAIDNSQLYSQTLETAVQFQHAGLPDLSEDLPGWDVAAHYTPAGRTGVGGDFYDVIPLPDGRVVTFVGDVMGRGVAAAAAMTQVRAFVRAFVSDDPEPHVVGRRLDTLMDAYDLQQLVTLVYLVVEPAAHRLRVLNAGHPPPVVLRADGSSEELPLASGPPLGAGPAWREVQELDFGQGDMVLAYTDGLVERRGEDIDVGQARLRSAVPMLLGQHLQRSLDSLVQGLRTGGHEDDVAALALRRRHQSSY